MDEEIESILNALKETPRLLKELIAEIEPELYAKEIIKGKWSIHEHATHVAVGDIYGFQKRMEDFKLQENPIFAPLSGENFSEKFFIELNLFEALEEFFKIRRSTIDLAYSLNRGSWNSDAAHPEYKRYTPYIILRHL